METKHAFTEGFFITPISNPSSRDLYDIGIDLALALDDSSALWELVEGAKAKSLAEMLGLTATIPAKLLHKLAVDPPAVALWNEAETLGRKITDLPPHARRSARAKLSQLRASMRNIPTFRDILSLQNGDPIPLMELWDVFHSTMEDKMTFVNWVAHKGNSCDGETEILLVIVQVDKQGLTTLHVRNIPHEVITLEKVAKWKSDYLDTVSLQDEELMDEALVLLAPLVEPLGDLTRPGDLLVFSPTGVLHSLPIHALTLSGQILLHRNPIIYSHSISVLRQCSSRAAQGKGHGALQNVAIFGNPTGDRPQSEESVKELSQALPTATMVVGLHATADKFAKATRQASLVHYHGHASEDAGDPLERSLVFADHDLLTARDVFNLRFECAPHVTLIACASAEQHISTGNEPLGILPAFLVAGAASIVGTLWPLRDADGARFSREFYRPFVKENNSGGDDSALSQMVNLATTLQRASLSIYEQQGTRAPYYWAAFVLHGAWFLWL
jgi:CHAT domain-containing protein